MDKGFFKRINDYLQEKSYSSEILFLVFVGICFLKIGVFSLGIQAPEVDWNWRLLTVFVFVVANLSILLVLFSPIFLMKSRRQQLIYGLLINFGLSFVIVANRVYNLFFHSYITLQTVAHSTEGLSMFQAIYSTVRMGEFLWIIDIPIIIYVFTRLRSSDYNLSANKGFSRLVSFALVAAFTIILWTPVMSMYTYTPEQHLNIQLRESGPFMFYTREAVAQTPMIEEGQRDVRDNPRIEEWFENNREDTPGELLHGKMEGKNLIVLQIEALQNVVIDKKINGQEITPNINKLVDESLFFSSTYDQTDMATADAEAMINFSLYPPGNVSAYMRYPDNLYNSLPRNFKGEGYSTSVMHGHFREFYNREEAYPNVGYEKFYSRSDYADDEIYNGLLGDKTFLEQSVDYLENQEEPFMSFIITLTSHHPFNYIEKEDYDEIDVSGYENTIVGDYIRSIHYTDAAVVKFYDLLEERGILDDSVLVFYGDHAAFNYNERDYRELNEFFGVNVHKPEEQITIHKVPFGIYDSEGELTGEIDENVGMIDIFPTVANIMGAHNQYTMGRDVLNTDEEPIVFRDNSFIKDNIYYYSKKDQFYDLKTGNPTQVDEGDEWLAEVKEALEISDLIYQNDYFRDKLDRDK